jgi:hypothetical protein
MSSGSVDSRLGFEIDRGTAGVGDRFLLIDGRRAYNLGISCQTCSLLFERLPGAIKSLEIERTAEALQEGVASLSDPVVETVARGLPKGEYMALLGEAPLRLVHPSGKGDYFCEDQITLWGEDTFWCLPHDPRIPYFRAGESDFDHSRRLFNFIVPMYPTKWLTFRPPSVYDQELRERGRGTAEALSILDVRSPADWAGNERPDPIEHWCLTHYLIDGHHKLHAASESGRPVRILSFVALAQSASSREQIEQAIDFLRISPERVSEQR